eukprot:4333345-Pyramimonas_sp.AAC.1
MLTSERQLQGALAAHKKISNKDAATQRLTHSALHYSTRPGTAWSSRSCHCPKSVGRPARARRALQLQLCRPRALGV